jgi:uncharacterized membrane protein
MSDEPLFLYIAAYDTEEEARDDYEALLIAHAAGIVGSYDSAVVVKGEDGKVHVHKHEKPTQHGAWAGIGVGAVVGILFPVTLIGAAAVGGVTGGVIGHLWRGMSRHDVRELGETLDAGEAAIIVIGKSTLEKALEKDLARANRRIEKQVKADVKALEKELSKPS